MTFKTGFLTAASVIAVTYAAPCIASAQDMADGLRTFNIVAQPLPKALLDFSEQTDIVVVAPQSLVGDVVAPEITGTMAPSEALEALLSGSGLDFEQGATGFTILRQGHVKEASASGASTGAQYVQIAQNDANPPSESMKSESAPAPDEVRKAPPKTPAEAVSIQDRIVVTGSRIRRSALDAPTPLQVIDAANIVEVGSVDLGEILEELPGLSQSISPDNTLTSTQNGGVSSVSLRNLGSDRTLTLIDGRRTVSNSGNAQRVNLGTIPSGFVDHVEVITGGASAVYGSDAVAGVVNIILEDNFEGFKGNFRYGASEGGGEEETSVDLTWGTNFNEERGNILLAMSFDKETEISATDRSRALVPLAFDDGEFVTSLSSYIPGGRFESDDAWFADGVWYNDQSLAPEDGRDPSVGFETDLDGYNYRPDYSLSPAEERLLLGLRSHYDITPNITAFADIQYADLETSSVNGYQTAIYTTSFGLPGETEEIGQIASDHPFIPDAVEETRSGSVSWYRRFNEVGRDSRSSDRETLRAWAGFEGQIGDSWNWEAWAGYGKFQQEQIRRNELNFLNIQNALNIEDDGMGGYQCVDADARADGCVPLNIFGEGSISAEAADYIRATAQLNQELTQTTAAANFSGDLFELPAGPLQVALGVEFRKEEQSTDGDDLVNAGVTGFAAIPDLEGEYDVSEAFIEISAPVFRDSVLGDKLTFDAALRGADYSTVGSVSAWKVGAVWSLNDQLTFRGQLATAQRAPSITELYSDLRGDFDTATDPCSGVTAASTGTVAENCLAIPGIQAAIAEFGQFEAPTSSIYGPNGGNLNLKEETSETVTFGLVFTPTFLPGFSAIIDYYDIEVEDAIGSVDTQMVLNLCYAVEDTTNNRFCDAITRSSDGTIEQVANRSENLNSLRSRGIDVTVNYDFEIPSVPGGFDAGLNYGYIDKFEEEYYDSNGDVVIDSFVGEVGSPEHEWRGTLGWQRENLRLRWKTKYVGEAVDDASLDKSDASYYEVESWMRHDIYASYAFETDPRFTIYAGVNNLFDDYGPFLPTGLNSGRSRNISSAYDVVGRFLYTGVRFKY